MDGPRAISIGRDARRMSDAAHPIAARIDARIELAYRLAAVILGDALEAEDAVADAALSAWRSRSSLRDIERFDAWFDRIVVNTCLETASARAAANRSRSSPSTSRTRRATRTSGRSSRRAMT